jgi:hypothetical protein
LTKERWNGKARSRFLHYAVQDKTVNGFGGNDKLLWWAGKQTKDNSRSSACGEG